MAYQQSRQNVSIDDLDVAIEWLEINDGEGGEADSCRRVAAFLKAEIKKRIIHAEARKNSVSPAIVRKAIAQASVNT